MARSFIVKFNSSEFSELVSTMGISNKELLSKILETVTIVDESKDVPKTEMTNKWCPDDSNEWIEVPDHVMSYAELGLNDSDMIQYILKRERGREKFYSTDLAYVDSLKWDHSPSEDRRILAYKVAK